MTQPDLTKLSDSELIEHLQSAEADKLAADLAAKKLKNEILNRKTAEIKAIYSSKAEPYGICNLEISGKILKIDTPKKVDWEQSILEKLWNQILADGSDPRQYIVAEYRVQETLYKTFGDNLKAYFEPARIVKAGSPSIKIINKDI